MPASADADREARDRRVRTGYAERVCAGRSARSRSRARSARKAASPKVRHGVVGVEPRRRRGTGRRADEVAALEGADGIVDRDGRLEVRLVGDVRGEPRVGLVELRVSVLPPWTRSWMTKSRRTIRSSSLAASSSPARSSARAQSHSPRLDGADAGVADEHRDALPVPEPPGLLEADPRDLEGRPRIAVGQRAAHVRPGPDLRCRAARAAGRGAGPVSRQPIPS